MGYAPAMRKRVILVLALMLGAAGCPKNPGLADDLARSAKNLGDTEIARIARGNPEVDPAAIRGAVRGFDQSAAQQAVEQRTSGLGEADAKTVLQGACKLKDGLAFALATTDAQRQKIVLDQVPQHLATQTRELAEDFQKAKSAGALAKVEVDAACVAVDQLQ
jgi:hypothetical protein